MSRKTETFCMTDYGKKSTFASFLPGISGIKGIPIWCYYVNRGQGVVSFGVDNKDHAIMEFYPAHQAYQNVKTTGFRTFIKKNGGVYEAFANEEVPHSMEIAMNGLKIRECNEEMGLETTVEYFTLPGETLGALVRKVVIKNTDKTAVALEVLDGMPAVIPYGVGLDSMKNMCQTAKAWMQVEDVESNIPYYRVRASMEDTAAVHQISGGNFSAGCLSDGTFLKPIVDPSLVFGYDNSMGEAVNFKHHSLTELLERRQRQMNLLPSGFYGVSQQVAPEEAITIYELIGQVAKKEILTTFFAEKKDEVYFSNKKKEAEELVEGICEGINTVTASKEFDAYCKYTYMDNVLRGGYPMELGSNKIFYVYSRKHGDIERDYNYFSMLPEFYSQGNGNFRDVNQNRRCDTFFAPFVKRENIKEFYSLIQLDGYNPLGVEKLTYQLDKEKANQLLDREIEKNQITASQGVELKAFVEKPFTPGALYHKMEELYQGKMPEQLFFQIIDFAEGLVNGNFGEGYWSDHWTYNLDLIEDYLEVFPDQEKSMLYEDGYTTFLSQININHRAARYAETEHGLRQYHALNEESRRNTADKLVRKKFGQGDVLSMTLLEKLVLLCATKFATLDAYGMGIEMEGGKPGWYDALNGMPGMLGSSMAETYELCRMLEYTISACKRFPGNLNLVKELNAFIKKLDEINQMEYTRIHSLKNVTDEGVIFEKGELLSFWNRINDAKEAYRDQVFEGISGETQVVGTREMIFILEGFLDTVKCGIEKACVLGKGICPTYFTYEVKEYKKTKAGYEPLRFQVQEVPYFLEGPVRYLKLKNTRERKQKLYQQVKNSDLYDGKLHMYKVNASLENASFELGRAKAFTPGWLENESIWLHMEYKYLLELIRNGMYEEFFADFHEAAVPFLNPKIYGRSIYENSSFIASSKNPDETIHGKGFVARLSGSTIEFISMWKQMMFGEHVMTLKNDALVFAPQPAIPGYLIPEDGKITATLFGKVQVTYQFGDVLDYIPGRYQIRSMKFIYENGSIATVNASYADTKIAEDIRNGNVTKIEIQIV